MPDNKIYVSNLNKTVTESQLVKRFSDYGDIAGVHLPRDKQSNELKGYGFITFADEDSAQQALDEDGQTFLEKTITVQIAVEKHAKK